MQRKTHYTTPIWSIFLIASLLVGLLPISALAKSVTGRYLKISGNTIVLEISVTKPAPTSIIVEQAFNKKNRVKSASPKPKKISSNGQVKWLVTHIRPGKKRFTLQLAAPLQGSVRAVLRYRDPSNGQFTEKSIRP